jgi:hypothetical protein
MTTAWPAPGDGLALARPGDPPRTDSQMLRFPAVWLRDIFDNTRVLHGRTAFTGTRGPGGPGERHLQGCYADLGSLASALAVRQRVEAV